MRRICFCGSLVIMACLSASSTALGQEGVDIVLEVPSGASPPGLAGYGARVMVSPTDAGLAFSGATQTANPVFPSGSPFASGGGNSMDVSDFLPTPGDSETIDSGEGLFRALFSLDPSAAGQTFDITVDPAWTNLSDADGNPIGYEISDGFVSVDAGGNVESSSPVTLTVPEPATLGLLAAGGVGVLLRRRR